MRTVPLGATGLSVSALCLGTMRFGTTTEEAASVAILDAYVAAGGRFLDTANVYAAWAPGGTGGESESTLGRWIRSRGNRDRLFVATKLGSRFQATGYGLRAAQIESEFEASRRRLGVETVDLLYAHFDDRQTPLEETFAAFDRLVRAGQVRCLGASNHRAWRLEEARRICESRGWPGYCCVQQRYSLAQPVTGASFGVQVAADDELLDYCAAQRLPLVAYSPLLGGVYGGRADRPLPAAYQSAANDRRLAALRELAREKDATPNQLALAWMLHHTPTVIPIAAGSTVAQMEENLGALQIALTPEDMKRLAG
jgi:aryl-alcohol dehydrogenase-like predicted oxidoreductase